MPWAWMAIRLTAFSLFIEPMTSLTRARSRPKRPARVTVDRDEIAVLGVAEVVGIDDQRLLLAVDRLDPRRRPA